MKSEQKKETYPLLIFLDRYAVWISILLFIGLFIIGDRLLNEYYLPDAKGIENSYYHHGLRKNFRGTVSWGTETHPLYTNDLGFKDYRRRDVPRKIDKHRVLFIGDSFTEGAGIQFGQTFVGLFREELPDVDVLNAGVVSYSPKLFYYRLKYLLEHEHLVFDELIVFIDISDINDEIEYSIWTPVEESPLRRLDSWLRSISFTYKILRKSLLNVEGNTFLQHLVKLIDPRKTVTQQPVDSQPEKEVPQQSAGDRGDSSSQGLPHVEMPPDFREKRIEERPRWTFDKAIYEKWGRTGMALAQYHMDLVIKLMQEHDIKVTVAVYPWPDQIRAADRNSIQEAEWQRFCADRHVPFISYFEDFFEEDPEETITDYFIPGDVHWNVEGHQVVFRKLLEHFKPSLLQESNAQ